MKSLLVSIANYGNTQLSLMKRSIEEFKSYKNFNVTISVHTTIDLDIPKIIITKYDDSIKWDLVYKHRWEFIKEIDNFDYFMFIENDTLVKEDALNVFCKHDPFLSENTCIGFVRYEKPENTDDLSLLDVNYWGGVLNKNIKIDDRTYFELDQQFQSCWILPQERLRKIMNLPFFPKIVYWGDTGSAGIFSRWGGNIKKITPQNIEELEACLIHHMSNKYVKIKNYPRRMFLSDLKKELKCEIYLVKIKKPLIKMNVNRF